MADKVGSVYIEIQAKMGTLEKDLKTLESRMQGANTSGGNLAKTLRNAATGIALSAALYKIVGALKETIVYASRLQETQNKFDVIFKSNKKQAEEFAKVLVDSYGLAKEESLAFLAGTGDILTGLGMTSEAALDLSNSVATLGIDLASFSNVEGGATRAIAALTSALTGEREALKAYGIVVSEEMIKAELTAKGKDKLTGAALNQAKAEATVAIAISQSGNAIGDMARSFDSYANIQRRVDSQTTDLYASLGTQLLPAMSNLGLAFLSASKDGGFLGDALKTVVGYVASTIDGIALLTAKLDQMRQSSKTSEMVEENKKLAAEYNRTKEIYAIAQKKAADGDQLFIRNLGNIKKSLDEQKAALQSKVSLSIKEIENEKKKGDVLQNIQDRIANGDKVLESNRDAISKREKERAKESNVTPIKQTAEKKKQLEQQLKDVEQYGSLEVAAFVKNLESKMEIYNRVAGVASGFASQLSNLANMSAANDSANIDNNLQKQQDALTAQYDADVAAVNSELITQEEKDAKLKALDEKKARESKALDDKAAKDKRKIARENAKIQKKLQIFQVLITTPMAAMAAFSALAGIIPFGPALGAAAAAATVAFGAAQIKLISEQPLPALAQGGIIPAVPGGQQFLAGEAGSAEAVIPLNDATLGRLAGMINSAGGGGGGAMNITLNVDGETLGQWFYNSTKNGQTIYSKNGMVA